MQEVTNQNINSNKNEKLNYLFFVFLFAVLVVIDQLTKNFAKNIFENHKFAFSLPLPIWLIYIVYAIVLCAMIIYYAKNYQHFTNQQSLAWTLIFAGAASNILERVILGYVKDWIYILTGIFNFADGYIIAGMLLLLFQSKITNLQSRINL
jgi:lipoprotein signal peptidase